MDARGGDPGNSGVGDERIVDRQLRRVVIRSTPRYGRFLWLGVAAGLLVALILTSLAGQTEGRGGPMSTGASGVLWVFMVYASACVGVGLLIMGVLAIVLARVSARHTRSGHAEHDTALFIDLHAPANDDVPRWVLDADDLAPGPHRADPEGDGALPKRPRA